VDLDPGAVTPGRRARRLAALNRRVDTVLRETYRDLARVARGQLAGAGEVQSTFAGQHLQQLVAGVGIEIHPRRLGRQFFLAILAEDPIQGAVMRDWWARQRRGAQFAFRRELQLGLVQQEPLDALVRRIRGRAVGGGRYAGGVLETTTREATALVRTAVTQIATRAAFETYRAQDDLTDTYQFVATLDRRTTPICRSLDGKVFRYDDPTAPRPPLHFQCRSIIIPVINWQQLGLSAPPPGTRAAEGGPVPADTDYAGWLRRQSATVQDAILGPSRARLFRAGKVTLETLVRSDGRQVTLDELRRRLT
jgi:SPP1 gp7 family putative phage head morphogenesis protein